MSNEAGSEAFKEIGARIIAQADSMDALRLIWFKNVEASKDFGPSLYEWFKSTVNARKAEFLAQEAQIEGTKNDCTI